MILVNCVDIFIIFKFIDILESFLWLDFMFKYDSMVYKGQILVLYCWFGMYIIIFYFKMFFFICGNFLNR